MSVKTQVASTANAIRLYKDAQNMFFGFGNTVTEWSTPNNPPLPDTSTNKINELAGIVKVSSVSLAKIADSSSTNTFLYGGISYEKVSLGDAYKKHATYVLISVNLDPDSLPTNVYRSVGLIESPQYSSSVTGSVVRPESIINQGNLLTIKYVPKVDYTGYTLTEQVLIEN